MPPRVFGFSFAELVVVIVVALVVIGPKDLPRLLRKLGQYAGKIRRTAAELRAQSGIDDALRAEGLTEDLAEIRKLARGELDAVRHAAAVDFVERTAPKGAERGPEYGEIDVPREREYPQGGADALGALPENAFVYAGASAPSALARDPLYVLGDERGIVPTGDDGADGADGAGGATVPEPTPPGVDGIDAAERPASGAGG